MKLLVEEDGSAEAEAAWASAAELASARLTFVEAHAALAAARRSRRVTRGAVEHALVVLREHWAEVEVVELDNELAAVAAALAERRALRSHDAVQLASALAADALLSWDDDLRRAAAAEGLGLAPPA